MSFVVPKLKTEVVGCDLARRLRFATPAVIGGAEIRGPASLGLPALLSGLRFWWRAGVHDGDIATMRSAEMALFGGPADETAPDRGTASFLPRLEPTDFGSRNPMAALFRARPGTQGGALVGFLGYAISSRLNNDEAKGLPEGSGATLYCQVRRAASGGRHSQALKQIEMALDLLTTFGGLGLLARRGLGSLNDVSDQARSFGDFAERVEAQVADVQARRLNRTEAKGAWNEARQHATISARTSCVLLDLRDCRSGVEALAALAAAVKPFAGRDPDHVFSAQHDLTVRRAEDRRSPSPLHIHVQRLAEGHAIVLTHLEVVPPTDKRAACDAADSRIRDFLTSYLPTKTNLTVRSIAVPGA